MGVSWMADNVGASSNKMPVFTRNVALSALRRVWNSEGADNFVKGLQPLFPLFRALGKSDDALPQSVIQFAVQEFSMVHQKEQPEKKWLSDVFFEFYKADVASYEAVEKWKDEGADEEGFQDALMLCSGFIAALNDAEDDDED